jgi:hypothetical protein
MEAITVKVEGLAEVEKRLHALKSRQVKHVIDNALIEVADPARIMATQLAPVRKTPFPKKRKYSWSVIEPGQPERRLQLKDAIITLLRTYRGGQVRVAVVGAMRGAPHAHLVESGTVARYRKAKRGTLKRAFGIRPKTGYTGIMPKMPFLAPAWEANKAQMPDAFALHLDREIWIAMGITSRQGLAG